MSTIFKLRRDTAANWSSNNPTLADGELGFDKTNVYLKIGDGTTAWNSLGQFTQSEESITDFIGGTVTGNTETFITVTYNDADNTLDFVVPVLDEDNLATNSATHLATQQSIKAYVDAQVTAQDLDFQGDSGGALSIDLDSETLDIAGGTNITTAGSGNTITVNIDPIDEDNMASNSATQVPSQQSVKAYVDSQVTAQDLDTAGDSGTGSIDLDSQSLTISGTANEITTVASNQGITIGLPDNVTIAGNLTVAGTQTTVSSTTVNVADPMLSLATNNGSADAVDIGFYGLYDTSGSQDLYSGLFRDANDSGKWKLYKDSQAEPTTTVNTGATGYAVGTLVANLEGAVTGNVTGNLAGDVTGSIAGATANMTGLVTYGSLSDGTITVTAFVDEDNMSSNSATLIPTQQSVKAYVDSQVTAQDLDFTADSGGPASIDLDSETLGIGGSTGINTSVSGNNVQIAIDFKDEDNMASDSATHAATQQSIKAYVDAQVTAQDLDFQGDSGGALSIDLDSETLDIAGGTGVTTTGSGNTLTVAIGQPVATSDNVQFANVVATGNLTVNGTTTTINTTNTTVTDSLVEYGTGTSGTPANDAGIVIERGDEANAFMGFDESANKFTVGTGTFTGASTGNLSITTGTLVANIEGATVSTTGNITVGGTVDGRDVAADGTKLDTVETNADVTDATNVEAAGAVMESGANASAKIPAGTTAQRDGSPSAGFLRWNTTIPQAEIYTGSEWSLVGGGNSTKQVAWEHESVLASGTNYVMEDGNNAISAGPITIDSNSSFTVGSGSVWAVM